MTLFDTANLVTQIHHYGSAGLFVLLSLGIIGLPIPDETLLLLSGTLAASNKMPLIFTWLACMGGALTGMTVSYILGRTAGHYTVIHVLKRFGISEQHLIKAHDWFERFGKWFLIIGYFIPGVRHFTGLVAGTTKLRFRSFALFAYSGAIIWSNFFFWLGYYYGVHALNFILAIFERYDAWVLIPIILLITAIFMVIKRVIRKKP